VRTQAAVQEEEEEEQRNLRGAEEEWDCRDFAAFGWLCSGFRVAELWLWWWRS
jgi:hypothetical protein